MYCILERDIYQSLSIFTGKILLSGKLQARMGELLYILQVNDHDDFTCMIVN